MEFLKLCFYFVVIVLDQFQLEGIVAMLYLWMSNITQKRDVTWMGGWGFSVCGGLDNAEYRVLQERDKPRGGDDATIYDCVFLSCCWAQMDT